MRRAVLDVGSNSVLLLISEWNGTSWTPVYEDTAVTALGEGTKATGVLGERGMISSLEAIKNFFERAREYGAEKTYAGATMAARIASNTADFLRKGMEQETPIHILSGEDEAQLGFEAVCSDPKFSGYGRISIIDPGGHSTELVTADKAENGWLVGYRRSFPIGTLGIRSSLLPEESNNGLSVLRATGKVDDMIGLCYRPGQCGHVIVLGAAGTNLISVREKYDRWEPEKVHGANLDYEEVSRAVGWLMPLTDEQRRTIPGLEKGREKTIHLGSFVLERFLFALRAESCSVSIRGWRHALLERIDDFQV